MQVAEGVLQFKVPMPENPNTPDGGLRYTLVYAVRITHGWMIIDAGMNTDEGFQAFQNHLAEARIAPGDIKLIVITHGHADHAGLANRYKELTGARLAMHRLDSPGGGRHPMQMTMDDPEGIRRWMLRSGVPPQDLQQGWRPRQHADSHGRGSRWNPGVPNVDWLLNGGEELVEGSDLWTIWTPGHSPGHVCIHDRKRRLLFSGDHVLPVITPHVSIYPGDEGDPLGGFLQAQQDLKELDVEMVHPAHEHSFPNLIQRVDEVLEHHRKRMDEILDQVQDGPKTAWQIASGIKWNTAPWAQLGTWTRRMAMMEALSHIQHMVLQGELMRNEADSLVHYARP